MISKAILLIWHENEVSKISDKFIKVEKLDKKGVSVELLEKIKIKLAQNGTSLYIIYDDHKVRISNHKKTTNNKKNCKFVEKDCKSITDIVIQNGELEIEHKKIGEKNANNRLD